jgi:peptidoglycan hydrolase CwlO-like protein
MFGKARDEKKPTKETSVDLDLFATGAPSIVDKKLPKEELSVKELDECKTWSKYGLVRAYVTLPEEAAALNEQCRAFDRSNYGFQQEIKQLKSEIKQLSKSPDSSDEEEDRYRLMCENTDLKDEIEELKKDIQARDEELESLRRLKENLREVKVLLE